MNGYIMYEVAKQRMAEQHRAADQRRAARQATDARKGRASGGGRRGGQGTTVAPVIPDFADELVDAMARASVPAPRHEATRGRNARSGN